MYANESPCCHADGENQPDRVGVNVANVSCRSQVRFARCSVRPCTYQPAISRSTDLVFVWQELAGERCARERLRYDDDLPATSSNAPGDSGRMPGRLCDAAIVLVPSPREG